MNQVYAPGCAFIIYKPNLAKKVYDYLSNKYHEIEEHTICCRHEPRLDKNTQIINTCAGCDKRFRELYEGISTISLWELLADDDTFPFPDYKGISMSIQDACPTRTEERVHKAIRRLLDKMNINVIEPNNTRSKATCCGDSFYGSIPVEHVKEQMKIRAAQMPCENVVVYCISCIKAMYIGNKKPHYMVDLLFGEDTIVSNFEPDEWHEELQEFIDKH